MGTCVSLCPGRIAALPKKYGVKNGQKKKTLPAKRWKVTFLAICVSSKLFKMVKKVFLKKSIYKIQTKDIWKIADPNDLKFSKIWIVCIFWCDNLKRMKIEFKVLFPWSHFVLLIYF